MPDTHKLPDAILLLEREPAQDQDLGQLLKAWQNNQKNQNKERALPESDNPKTSDSMVLTKTQRQKRNTVRLIRRFEIKGINKAEADRAVFQSCARLGLDKIVDPLELFDGQILVYQPVSQTENPESVSAEQILHLLYPYRKISVYFSWLLIFESAPSTQKQELDKLIHQSFGFQPGNLRRHCFEPEIQTLPLEPKTFPSEAQTEQKLAKYFAKQKTVKIFSFAKTPGPCPYIVLIAPPTREKGTKIYKPYDRTQLGELMAHEDLKSICQYAFNTRSMALIPGLLMLPFGSRINLDVLHPKIMADDPDRFLFKKGNDYLILLIDGSRIDQLFSLLQQFDLSGQVIGKTTLDHKVCFTYHGETVIELDRTTYLKINQEAGGQEKQKLPFDQTVRKSHKRTKKLQNKIKNNPHLLVLHYPGSRGEQQGIRFAKRFCKLRNTNLDQMSLSISGYQKYEDALKNFGRLVKTADVILIPDGLNIEHGFISTEQMVANFLEHSMLKETIEHFLERGGKIIGLGNGFLSLLLCGLLPYGRFRHWGDPQISYLGADQTFELLIPPELREFCYGHHLLVDPKKFSEGTEAQNNQDTTQKGKTFRKENEIAICFSSANRQIFGFYRK